METRPAFQPTQSGKRLGAIGNGELDALRGIRHFLPGLGRFESRAGPLEQRHSRRFFELAHLKRDGRRCEMKGLGRAPRNCRSGALRRRFCSCRTVTCRMRLH